MIKISRKSAATAGNLRGRALLAKASAVTADEIIAPLFDGSANSVFSLTGGQASQIDLVLAAIRRMRPVRRVSLWTWAIADYELLAMSEFLKGVDGCEVRLLVDRSCALRQPAFLRWVAENIGMDSVRCTHSHAKIATVLSHDGRVITIRGSMNLNKNPRCEQVDICINRDVFAVIDQAEAELWASAPPLSDRDLAHAKTNSEFERIFGGGANSRKQEKNSPSFSIDEIDEWLF